MTITYRIRSVWDLEHIKRFLENPNYIVEKSRDHYMLITDEDLPTYILPLDVVIEFELTEGIRELLLGVAEFMPKEILLDENCVITVSQDFKKVTIRGLPVVEVDHVVRYVVNELMRLYERARVLKGLREVSQAHMAVESLIL